MDDSDREPFQQRWERLKQHLDEAKSEQLRPWFRFSLAAFLIATVATGVTIGSIMHYCGSDGIVVLVVVSILVLYIATTGCGLGVCLWVVDRGFWHRYRAKASHRRRLDTANGAGDTAATPGYAQNDQVDLPVERSRELEPQ